MVSRTMMAMITGTSDSNPLAEPSAMCAVVVQSHRAKTLVPMKTPRFGKAGGFLASRQLYRDRFLMSTELNLNDPFERAVFDIVRMNRKKRRDYAADGDPFSNFRTTSDHFGLEVWESAEFNLVQKIARLRSLRANGRMDSPENEAVGDTYLDAAVYAVILWALYSSESDGAEEAE